MIGVFDSGLGGLSVLREVRRLLPLTDYSYYADTAYCPYGPRPVAFVQARSLAIAQALLAQGAQLLLVACNTATSAAIEHLRAALHVPVVGIEPGIKPATQATRTGKIGVLATSGTLAGDRFATLVERFANGIEVFTQPCPGLVELVERGELVGPNAAALVERYVTPLLARDVDTLVLGCTHYPFLAPVIAAAAPSATIIDTRPAVARQVERVAAELHLSDGKSQLRLLTSGDPAIVAPIAARLLGEPVPCEQLRAS